MIKISPVITDPFRVKVITENKNEVVRAEKDGRLTLSVRAKRERGAANVRVRELLAEHFGVPMRGVVIVRGHTSSTKTIMIKGGGGK
jgi:uncharacterized protein YggU (UPF0235/DUF167 family)